MYTSVNQHTEEKKIVEDKKRKIQEKICFKLIRTFRSKQMKLELNNSRLKSNGYWNTYLFQK